MQPQGPLACIQILKYLSLENSNETSKLKKGKMHVCRVAVVTIGHVYTTASPTGEH